MQSIILQQLRIEFGEDFDELYNNTRSYVKGLISRPWWIDRGALVSSEGPLSRMVEDCLAHVVEKGDKQAGWQSYTSYLSSLYGRNVSNAKAVNSMDEAQNRTGFLWSTLGQYNSSSPSSETLDVESEVSDSPLDEEHKDFLGVYYSLGVKRAAEEYGLTPKQARARRNTIKRTALRRVSS